MVQRRISTAVLILLFLASFCACDQAKAPPNVRLAHFQGDAYDRGVQHGKRFANDIRSIYTRLLENSLLPYLNLERANIAPVLGLYYDEKYDNGQFSYLMLLESGQHLYDDGYIPEEFKNEMHGIADGSGIEFEKILLLNTFMDTMMAFRAVSLFIQAIQKPHIIELEFITENLKDDIDNNGNFLVDEDQELKILYESTMVASMLEVPTDAAIRFVLIDETLTGHSCADAGNVEPIGQRVARRECVNPECISEGCENEELLSRECIGGPASLCLRPNISMECFDPDCVEPLDPGCIDPETLRLRLNDRLYIYADEQDRSYFEVIYHEPPEKEGEEKEPMYRHSLDCDGEYEVIFTPPEGLPEASKVSVTVQVQDMSRFYTPEPFHARSMRDERFVFTTAGYKDVYGNGEKLHEISNMGLPDGTKAPTFSFAVRGEARPEGQSDPLLAHHYILVDSDIMHEHTLLALHEPDDGIAHVTLGWTGIIWGFHGMNADGLAYTVNNSDTLDSPMVGNVIQSIYDHVSEILAQPDLSGLAMILDDVKLLVTGRPMGLMGRELLAGSKTVEEGLGYLHSVGQTFGWNILLGDAQGSIAAVELDASSQQEFERGSTEYSERDGFSFYTPDDSLEGNLNPQGERWSSIGPDDLRMASHYVKNTDDMAPISLFGPFSPREQREWSSYYTRSIQAYHVLGEEIHKNYGKIDLETAIGILRKPELVDDVDSMIAVIMEPAARRLHYAMGGVPATDMPFIAFDLQAALNGEVQNDE